MKDTFTVSGFRVVWVVLNRWVLSQFGVQT